MEIAIVFNRVQSYEPSKEREMFLQKFQVSEMYNEFGNCLDLM
jgi:hypothetical protein